MHGRPAVSNRSIGSFFMDFSRGYSGSTCCLERQGFLRKKEKYQRRMRKYKAGAYTEIMSELENRAETPSLSLSRLISLLKNGKIQAVWIDIDQTLLSFDLCARDAMVYACSKVWHRMDGSVLSDLFKRKRLACGITSNREK